MNSLPSPHGAMTALQNRWYNSLVSGLLLNRQTFQLIQPSFCVKNNCDLWEIQNQIPPFTLTWNQWVYDSNLLFTKYAAIVKQITFPESKFEDDIGKSNYQAWKNYLQTLSPPPSSNQLPTIFRNWSILKAPNFTKQGTSDLAQMVLIDSTKKAIKSYEGSNAKQIDFVNTFSQLSSLLSQSQSASFALDSSAVGADVEDTWTQGINPCFFGLWTGSWCGKTLSRKFAVSKVQVVVQFEHWTTLRSTPSTWYNSSLLNLAYSSDTNPPWSENPSSTWDCIFGSQGIMQWLISSLVIVDGMTVTITSDAVFDSTEQAEIKQYCRSGFWPFYCQSESSSGVVKNMVSFLDNTLEIQTVTSRNNPIVIGANILDISHYLGHTVPN